MMKIHTAIEIVVLYVTVIFAAANNITALPTTDRLELSTKLIDEQVNQRNGSYLLLTTPDSKLKNIAFSDQVTTGYYQLLKVAVSILFWLHFKSSAAVLYSSHSKPSIENIPI